LCFPPKQTALSDKHAITFSTGPARDVGIYLPKEILLIALFGVVEEGTARMLRPPDASNGIVDDETQVPLIPEFLDALRQPTEPSQSDDSNEAGDDRAGDTGKGGIKRLHLLYEDWRTSLNHSSGVENRGSMGDLESCRDKRLFCEFDGDSFTTMVEWTYLSDTLQGGPLGRNWWWLGSGHKALAGRVSRDMVEAGPGWEVERCATRLEMGCAGRRWEEFEGVEVLGWVTRDTCEDESLSVDL
jgi:hypothetical protein